MSTSIQSPKFVSKDEEIKYWKNLAHEYMEEYVYLEPFVSNNVIVDVY